MTNTAKKYTTDGKGYQIAAAAVSRSRHLANRVVYSHAVDFQAQKVLCSRVKFESILDDSCITDEKPSCPACQRALARMAKTAPV